MSAIRIPEKRNSGTKLNHALMTASAVVLAVGSAALSFSPTQAQEKRANIVMLMTDDTGWSDFGTYSGGGVGLGHPTPNVDQIAKEGATFTNWYGQASCIHGLESKRPLWVISAHTDKSAPCPPHPQ